MKRWFASLPIRGKLMLLAGLASGTALLVAGIVLSVADYQSGRRDLIQRVQVQAQIAARNSSAAVAFDDAQAANRILEAMTVDKAIVAMEVLRLDGTVLAQYGRSMDAAARRFPKAGQPHVEPDGLIHVNASVVLDERIGTVNLWATAQEVQAALLQHSVILLGVIIGALGLAMLAVARLQRLVSAPLIELAQTTATVSRTRDYSLRVENRSSDEVGQLVGSFNDMLGQIEARDRELRGYQTALEQKVEARTVQLQKALQDAQAATRAKADFLANMSHEIRTPMNGVIGMLDLVDVGQLDREQGSMVETARNSADALLTLINDILDFSKIDAGKLVLESIEVELRPLVEDIATLFSNQAHAKGLEVVCAVHQDVPAVMLSDPTRLRQILSNLIGNAVKFTDKGEVFVGLLPRSHETRDDVLPIQIVIRDTGIGMSEEARLRLFEAFMQADSSTTRKYGGTGLGLAITKRLIDAMGGTIKVGSELGRGSTFSVILPLRIAVGAKIPKPADLRGLNALIVDDNRTNRCILEHYLTSFGMDHESVESGPAGLAAVRAAADAGRPFDVVVLDYQMPDMDGMGFLQQLRADPRTAGIDCVVLSSLGDRAEIADTLDVSAWLTKPVRQAQLQNMLATVAGRSLGTERIPAQEPTKEATYRGARVLLVEDNRVNQEVARRLLRTFGINAKLAVNGAAALEAIRAETFDLIFMDCQMPVMDGYEATRAARSWELENSRARSAIVAMTANAMEGDRDKCIAAGMDDYVPKPIKRAALAATLARWLKADTVLPPSAGASEKMVAQPKKLDLENTAFEQLRELFGSDLADIIETYLSDTPGQLAAIAKAIEHGEYAVLGRAAHSLKSSSNSIGAREVGTAAATLEALVIARHERPELLQEIVQQLAALRAAFADIEPQLRAAIVEDNPAAAFPA